MTGHPFTLQGATLVALPSGALHWPEAGLLTVSDLHFGKSERIARRGGTMLPPYETQDTLTRLESDIRATAPRTVICLGDSFDDLEAAQTLDDTARLWLARLMAGREWIWIEGNHDPGPIDLGGTHRAELTRPPLTFRHIARPGATGEISGHYHPKAPLGRGAARPCFLTDEARVILPAYGTYTGGLRAQDPVLQALMGADARAFLLGRKVLPIPMPRP